MKINNRSFIFFFDYLNITSWKLLSFISTIKIFMLFMCLIIREYYEFLFSFLAVGTGALSDMCACLKHCAKSDTENAYADLGDGHDIAGKK